MKRFGATQIVPSTQNQLFAQTGHLIAQAFTPTGVATNTISELQRLGEATIGRIKQTLPIDRYFGRTANVDLSLLREWYETSRDAPSNSLTWGRSAFGDSDLRQPEDMEETWLDLLQGVYKGATQPSLETATR